MFDIEKLIDKNIEAERIASELRNTDSIDKISETINEIPEDILRLVLKKLVYEKNNKLVKVV